LRLIACRVLILRAQPADNALPLFCGAFGIQRREPFQNLFVGQVRRPANVAARP